MKTVWIVELYEEAQENSPSHVFAVCATEAGAKTLIEAHARINPADDWRTNRRGFAGNWSNKHCQSFVVKERAVTA